MQRLAIDAELEPLRLVEDRNVVEAGAGVTRQLHANGVFAVSRECIAQAGSAARAERQTVDAIVLTELGRNGKRVGRRPPAATLRRPRLLIFCAAAMYRSISVGDIRCTPAILSNP